MIWPWLSGRAATGLLVLVVVLAVGCSDDSGDGRDSGNPVASAEKDAEGTEPSSGEGGVDPGAGDFSGKATVEIDASIREFSTDTGCVIAGGLVQISMGDQIGEFLAVSQVDEQTLLVQLNVDGVRWDAAGGTEGLSVAGSEITWTGEVIGGSTGNDSVTATIRASC